MHIRRARLQELITISRLDRESNMTPWTVPDYLWCYESNKHDLRVLCSDDEIIGLMALGVFDTEVDILQFFIVPKHHKTGLGKYFLGDAIAGFKASKYNAAFLEVRVDNNIAISLYSKLGFEIVGTREAYYNINGKTCDAFVMKLSLTNTLDKPTIHAYTKRDYPLM